MSDEQSVKQKVLDLIQELLRERRPPDGPRTQDRVDILKHIKRTTQYEVLMELREKIITKL